MNHPSFRINEFWVGKTPNKYNEKEIRGENYSDSPPACLLKENSKLLVFLSEC